MHQYKEVVDSLLGRLLAIRMEVKNNNKVVKESVQMCVFFIAMLFDVNTGAIKANDEDLVGIIESTMNFCEVLEEQLGIGV